MHLGEYNALLMTQFRASDGSGTFETTVDIVTGADRKSVLTMFAHWKRGSRRAGPKLAETYRSCAYRR
jgi:hypothetical protein